MRIVAFYLFATTLAPFVSDVNGICDDAAAKNCLTTYTNAAPKVNKAEDFCKIYNSLINCMQVACQNAMNSSILEQVNKQLKDSGIDCSSGTNIQFSITLVLAAILFLNCV